MPLFNLAWAKAFFWDGRAPSLRQQVLMPIQDPHEMNLPLDQAVTRLSEKSPAFNAAFGSPEITPDRLAKALEQYLLTLISQDSRFDRAARKVATLTEQEKRGLQLYVTEHDPARGLFGADCFHCHGGTLFTDHSFKNNGLDLSPDDLGLMATTGKLSDKAKFKTPSLRNIAATAPYMHDGRFDTLEQVVAHYSGPLTRSDTLDPNLAKHPAAGIQLSPDDQQALVAFLKTLTDESFLNAGKSGPSLAKQP
jgi:cytochrome c peroxidase